MHNRLFVAISTMIIGMSMHPGMALADKVEMRSKPWQVFFQDPMSPTAEKIYDLNVFLLWIEVIITVFVLGPEILITEMPEIPNPDESA